MTTDNRLFDPISGTAILVSLAISAATTAASVGLEHLVAKGRKVPPVDRGKLDDVRVSMPGYGEPIIRGWGLFRCAPVWFWHTPIVHSTIETPGKSGGKGSPKPPTPATIDHIYTTSIAGVVCEGPINEVRRMWFDNDLVYNTVVTGGTTPLSSAKFEAEDATLAGGANAVASSACSNGQRVQGIGSGGTVEFSVAVLATGTYELGVYYTSTVDRTFKISVNGGANTDMVCLASGDANVVAIQTRSMELNIGLNTILFSNAGAAAPDLDKIEVVAALVTDPEDPVDRRRFTGLVNPNMVAPSDQDMSWAYYNDRPEADANGTTSTNLAKYGQPSIRIYSGTETQTADSAIIADKGASNAPAYRGVAYIVIEGLQLPSGRVPNVTLEVDQGTTNVATINQDLYGLVGVASSNLTLTALSGDTLTGFVIPSRKTAGEAISELQTRFQYDLPEVDGKVKATKRNGASDLTISYTDLRAHLDGEEMPAFDALITDIDPLLLPKRVDVNYQDQELDYHNNTQSDMRLVGPQYDEQTVSLSIIDTADNVKKLATILLYRPDMEGRSFKFTTGPKYMRVHPGSVVTLTLPNATHVCRITEAKYQLPAGVCEFEGVRQQASIYSPTGTGSISTGYEAPIAPIPSNTKGVIIDGPILRPEDGGDGTQPVVYVAMCGRGAGTWPGGFLYQEFPIDSGNYKFVTAADKPSNIGVTAGVLAATWVNTAGATIADPAFWDRTNSLLIKFLSNTELSSATEQDLLANPTLNLLAIINPSTNAVEYIQFKTAIAGVATAPYYSQYTVSVFLRGGLGTYSNLSNHTSADDVVVIDSTIKPRRMELADINRALKFKFVSSGQAEEDAVTNIQTLQGNSLKPLAPVNLIGTRNSSGDLLIEWTRSSRIGAGLRPSTDVPVAEESETYKVEVYSGATLKRSWIAIPGISQAVMWMKENRFAVITKNNLENDETLIGSLARARSAQKVLQSGFFVEAEFDEGGGDGEQHIGIIPVTESYESNNISYSITADFTGATVVVRENFGSILASTTYSATARYRIMVVGSEIRFYKNYVSINNPPPFYISRTPPGKFPYRAWGAVAYGGSATGEVRKAFMSGTGTSTIYSGEQQTEDFGSTQTSLKVRVYQISSVVGPGNYLEKTI